MPIAPAHQLERGDYLIFGETVLEYARVYCNPADEKLERIALELVTKTNGSSDIKELRRIYRDMIDWIESEGGEEAFEALEICMDCGHLPTTGACHFCRQD